MASTSDAKQRIDELREKIARHDRLYYVENAPEISDEAYDRLFAELEALEKKHPDLATPDSPTRRIGAEPESELERVRHIAPMQSLDAVREERAVGAFLSRLRSETGERKAALFVEPKFDGLSVEAVYRDGRFLRAATRGDGETGEKISHTLRTVRALPLRLVGAGFPGVLAVRGEALLPKESFQKANKARLERGDEAFANPRNAAAGVLRRLDPSEAAGIRFAVTFYDAVGVDIDVAPTQGALLDRLEGWGFPVLGPRERCTSLEDARAFHRRLAEKRDHMPYEIDGIVLKLDDRAARKAMGTRARSPRWALAWKFPPRKRVTRIADIAVSVGRTGALTPVALLDPVDIGGVTVSRATLHNIEEVRRKDLRAGDMVRVERAGDVIPEVVERVKTPGRKRGPQFEMPSACPACGADIERRGPRAFCPAGIACPAQLAARIVHYAARGAMDIHGLGEKTAAQLVERGMVGDIADLYDLSAEQFKALDGFAAKSAKALHDAIQARRDVPLDRFLAALGIRHVGADAARRLARAFGTLPALREASEGEIAAVGGIGTETAESIAAFLAEQRNREVLDRLIAAGVSPRPVERVGASLDGKTFVLTGALEGWTRDEATREIVRRGGRVASAVSGRTDYVVVGADPGSKLDDARAQGVETIDESAFRKILG